MIKMSLLSEQNTFMNVSTYLVLDYRTGESKKRIILAPPLLKNPYEGY